MRRLFCVVTVLTWVALVPVPAFAQSSITGVVKDTSGAVLPGVTVEAASPVLIEKVTTAVTDGTGQYRIIDLRPGTYTRDVHADRVRHRQARRAACCRPTSSPR